MNNIINILCIILMFLVFGAPSCVDEAEITRKEQEALDEVRSNIRDEFETKYLSEAALYAYETNAKQKLIDLADFMHVLMDSSLDNSFRQKAGQMIQAIFRSENEKIQLFQDEEKPDGELTIDQLINNGFDINLKIQTFSFENIYSLKPLQRENQYTYSGLIRFSQLFYNPSNPDQVILSIERTSEVFVVKETKKFGMDSLNVWNVCLGQIK